MLVFLLRLVWGWRKAMFQLSGLYSIASRKAASFENDMVREAGRLLSARDSQPPVEVLVPLVGSMQYSSAGALGTEVRE